MNSNPNPSAEAELQSAIEARRVQALAQLTDEDSEIIFGRGYETFGTIAQMIRAERKEASLVNLVAAMNSRIGVGGEATVVDCVALQVAAQEAFPS